MLAALPRALPCHRAPTLLAAPPRPASPRPTQVIPGSDAYRYNFWGYSTVGYFAPMARYSAAAAAGGAAGQAVLDEFRQLVKECHRRGIEVILDVVFNHTAEGNEQGPTLSFRRAPPLLGAGRGGAGGGRGGRGGCAAVVGAGLLPAAPCASRALPPSSRLVTLLAPPSSQPPPSCCPSLLTSRQGPGQPRLLHAVARILL